MAAPGPERPGPERPGPSPVHWSARAEDAVNRRVTRLLRRLGWEPRVLTSTGYGTPDRVRVLARVLLTPPGVRTSELAATRGWRRFVAVTAPGVPVRVEVGGRRHDVVSARGGYVDEVLDAELAPGWAEAVLTAPASSRPPQTAHVRVVGPGPGLGLVSDVDDTVVITALPRPLLAFWNTFVRHEAARRPVPGMAEFYRQVCDAEPDTFVVYLSTGAWNVAPSLREFLSRCGFPRGPLLLTDWGPTPRALFRSGTDHKRDELRRLFTELPQLRWLLVGDDGQHDPQVYAEVADRYPDRVAAVAIRQLSAAEQVRTHGRPVPPPAARSPDDAAPTPVRAASVASVRAPDGLGLLTRLRARGLLRSRVR